MGLQRRTRPGGCRGSRLAMQYPSDFVDFGHPDPPRVQVLPVFTRRSVMHNTDGDAPGESETTNQEIQEDIVLVVCYTEHCVVAQALHNTGSTHTGLSSEVLVIGSLPVIEPKGTDETIHCATVVARGSLDFLNADENGDVVMDDSEEPTENDPTVNTRRRQKLKRRTCCC